MKNIGAVLIAVLTTSVTLAAEFHVSVEGNDANDGSAAKPFKTVSAAAQVAQPGDTITVHAGTYRERVAPPRGGESDAKRIVYQAAPGEKVEIKGSEVVQKWEKVQDDVWKTTLSNTFFGDFNPFSDLIRGDWFDPKGRQHHTGAVYLDGFWLREAAKLDDVLKPAKDSQLWFAEVDSENTTIWARFKGVDPNTRLVEVNVRKTVFYPEKPGVNYITVRGFTLSDAATPWAPPTAEQIGLIGTHWSKGWIIENNTIRNSACSGVALGKYGDQWDNTSAESAEGYVKTIERAIDNGWNKETIGHHIVRNNTISHCEQAGVVGSLGAIFSQIIGNHIHDVWAHQTFSGAEMAGIKIHAAIDVLIQNNRIHNAGRGLWMDWMAQGTRITGNLCYDNCLEDLFVEVDHGPFLVDNNLLLSRVSLRDCSQGGAYVHNLFGGQILTHFDERFTPYHEAHSTVIAGMSNILGGDDRFYNNVFIGDGADKPVDSNSKQSNYYAGYGLFVYDAREFPIYTGGNVYYRKAHPYAKETDATVVEGVDPKIQLVEEGEKVSLKMTLGEDLKKATTAMVTTERLGKARVPQLGYENPDGSPLQVDLDYHGKKRDPSKPTAGPFENPKSAECTIPVWGK